MNQTQPQVFSPAHFLTNNEPPTSKPVVLLILNQPILEVKVPGITDGSNARDVFDTLWNYCSLHVCADGGANRLFDYLGDESLRQQKMPHIVAGDFDSLRPEVLDYYQKNNVIIKHDDDQYATDFMKCVNSVKENFYTDFDLLVIGGLGGRIDHSFHSLHHLYLSFQQNEQLVYLISPENVSFLLPPGTSELETPLRFLGKTCGLIPLSGSAHITTSGLEWDVTNWETSFGSKISTSNHLLNDRISVTSDSPILFTAELRTAK